MIPTKAGFYWAKAGNYKWFHLLIKLEGKAPFLYITAFIDRANSYTKLQASDIAIDGWGERIPLPEGEEEED